MAISLGYVLVDAEGYKSRVVPVAKNLADAEFADSLLVWIVQGEKKDGAKQADMRRMNLPLARRRIKEIPALGLQMAYYETLEGMPYPMPCQVRPFCIPGLSYNASGGITVKRNTIESLRQRIHKRVSFSADYRIIDDLAESLPGFERASKESNSHFTACNELWDGKLFVSAGYYINLADACTIKNMELWYLARMDDTQLFRANLYVSWAPDKQDVLQEASHLVVDNKPVTSYNLKIISREMAAIIKATGHTSVSAESSLISAACLRSCLPN